MNDKNEQVVKWMGQDIMVEFDHQPEEKQDRQYPGCDECVDITEVFVGGVNITVMVEELDQLAEVAALVLVAINDEAESIRAEAHSEKQWLEDDGSIR